MSVRHASTRSFRSLWTSVVALLCCVALVACKSPDDDGRGDASDSQQKGTTGK